MGCHPLLRMDMMRQGTPSIYHKASLGVVKVGPVFLDIELGEIQCSIEEEYLAPQRRFMRTLKEKIIHGHVFRNLKVIRETSGGVVDTP